MPIETNYIILDTINRSPSSYLSKVALVRQTHPEIQWGQKKERKLKDVSHILKIGVPVCVTQERSTGEG